MPRPSKKTPTRLAALKAARAEGKGLRAAAVAAGVSHETARAWEQRDAKRGARPPVSNVVAIGADADAAVREPIPQGLADLRQRLAFFNGLLERLAPAVERDEYPASNYVTLSRYVDELNGKIAELEPPAPTQTPAETVDDREAARIVHARLEGMIGEAEGRASAQRTQEVGR